MKIVFLDLETTGLDPLLNQTVEVAMVPMESGSILTNQIDHFYISHPRLTYDVEALKKFGTRLDRQYHVPVLQARDAAERIRRFMIEHIEYEDNVSRKPHLGGKNVGGFDLQFLKALSPQIPELVKHRSVDLGNLFHRWDDKELPDLNECLKRGKAMGIDIQSSVTHTALDDAMVCSELYVGWCKLQMEK